MDPGFLILKVQSDGDSAEFTIFGVGSVAFVVVSAGAGAYKLEFRAAEHVFYGVLGVIQIVVVITFLGFVVESNRYLSGECVLLMVGTGPRSRLKMMDFFSASRRAFFTLALADSSGLGGSGRAAGMEAVSR